MQIRWTNVVSFALGTFVLVILIRYRESIQAFLESMLRIGPGYDSDDRTVGLIAFAVALVGLLGLIKILTQKDRQ
jgi:multisubunit Na+/H+ antiporter MnhF subunit